MSWRSEEVRDVLSWVRQYAARRYDTSSPNVQLAWQYLLEGAYQFHWSGHLKGFIERAPDFSMQYYSALHATNISNAWLLLVSAAEQGVIDPSVGPLQYDVVDLGRQVLVNFFVDLHAMYSATYNQYTHNKFNTSMQLNAIQSAMLQLFDDLDMLLASDTNFLLGHWISDARASVPNTSSSSAINNAEFNARNQITMWGPNQNIEDYASKEWAGLVKDYYKQRWALFTNLVNQAVKEDRPFDRYRYESERYLLERKFSYDIKSYPTSPIGNPFTISSQLMEKYFYAASDQYVIYGDSNAIGNDLLEYPAWNTLVGQLAYLCNVHPDCVGFNSDGYLKKFVGDRVHSKGTTLYVKRV